MYAMVSKFEPRPKIDSSHQEHRFTARAKSPTVMSLNPSARLEVRGMEAKTWSGVCLVNSSSLVGIVVWPYVNWSVDIVCMYVCVFVGLRVS